MQQRNFSNSFLDTFPGTAGLLMVISAFFVLEFILNRSIPAVAVDPERANSLLESFHHKVFLALGSSAPRRILDGELWRLLACVFLHANLIHIALNAMTLVDLGRHLEPMLGTERFLTVYLASGLGGSLATLGWRSWRDFEHLALFPGSVGASGAICGLIGVLFGFSLRHRDRLLRDQVLRSLAYLVIFSVAIPNIDHFGHLGGLLTGAVFGFFTPRYTSSAAVRRWRLPCWVFCGVTALCLGIAVWQSFQVEFE